VNNIHRFKNEILAEIDSITPAPSTYIQEGKVAQRRLFSLIDAYLCDEFSSREFLIDLKKCLGVSDNSRADYAKEVKVRGKEVIIKFDTAQDARIFGDDIINLVWTND